VPTNQRNGAPLRRQLGLALAMLAGAVVACASPDDPARQSPIDIRPAQTVSAPLAPVMALYQPLADVSVVNTFDPAASPFVPREFATLRVNVPAGSSVVLDGVTYDLLQFHFHSPAEHTVRGRVAPMEMHFVHLRRNACLGDSDALLVIGARIVAGAGHRALDRIFSGPLPADSTEPALPVAGFQLASVLPDLRGSWRYGGSLTAPSSVGCNNPAGTVADQLQTGIFPENVHWIVVPAKVQLSRRQIQAFQALFNFEGNARPTQPLNGRTVLQDR
jgi:carbonic anhydrase